MFVWILGTIAALLALGGLAFWIALQVNSVAVLDTLDKLKADFSKITGKT